MNDELAEKLLAAAAEEGVYVVLRFEERRDRGVVVEGEKVEVVHASYVGGLGVQAYTKTGHCGFAAVDDPDEERALRTFRRAAAGARAAEAAGLAAMDGLLDTPPLRDRADPAVPHAFGAIGVGEMRDRAQGLAARLLSDARDGAGADVNLRTSFGISRAEWRILRSDGTDVAFTIPRSQLGVVVTARRDGEAVRTNASVSGRSWELLLDEAVTEEMRRRARAAADLARGLLDAPAFPPGSYRLLIDYALAKGLAHEAFGHAAESDGLDSSILGRDGRFRSGETFGGRNVSIIDESVEGDNAYQPFSGNGLPRRRAVILERGVLRDSLSDALTARRAGTPATGAARLASFAAVPIPRMSNIRIEVEDPYAVPEGKDFYDWTPEAVRDLLVASGDLAEGDRIVFLSGYRGGQVNPALGDFVFHSTALYDLTPDAVTLYKPGIFSGRIEAALHSIRRGFGPLRLDAAGTCGKAGQGVPSSGGSHHFVLLDENAEVRIGGRS